MSGAKSCGVFFVSLFVGATDDDGDVDDGVGDVDDGVGDVVPEDFAFFFGVATGLLGLACRGIRQERKGLDLCTCLGIFYTFRYKRLLVPSGLSSGHSS